MRVFHYSSVKAEDAEGGAAKTKVRWLITDKLGAPNFVMRLFEMTARGHSPLHSHDWEHEVFILRGEGQLYDGCDTLAFKTGDVIFVSPNEKHQFKNTGEKTLKFLCLIPLRK